MKLFLLLLCLPLGLLAQSLPTTTSWMQPFANSHAIVSDELGKDSINPLSILATKLDISGCKVRATIYKGGAPINASADIENSTTKFSLSDLDPKSVRVDIGPYSGCASVSLETTNATNSICLSGYCPHLPIGGYNSWLINFDDKVNAERFAKAMRHAIVLCGGKASAF